MSEIIKEGHCTEGEIANLYSLLNAAEDKVSDKFKHSQNLGHDYEYTFFDATKNHIYKTYKFRFDQMITNGKYNKVSEGLEVLIKNLELSDLDIVRLTFIKTKGTVNLWIFSDPSYTNLLGFLEMPPFPKGRIVVNE